MNEQQFQVELKDTLEMLDTFAEIEEETITIDNISTFEEDGILTTNTGIVVKLSDKSEFQVTILRSK